MRTGNRLPKILRQKFKMPAATGAEHFEITGPGMFPFPYPKANQQTRTPNQQKQDQRSQKRHCQTRRKAKSVRQRIKIRFSVMRSSPPESDLANYGRCLPFPLLPSAAGFHFLRAFDIVNYPDSPLRWSKGK